MGRTTISVSDETADVLHDMKKRGESYDDVIVRLLIENEDLEEDPRED
jgi:predicted CopG family antitoxin